MSKKIWIGDNGETFCTAHAGRVLAIAVTKYPNKKFHTTPFGMWLLGEEENDVCEVCTIDGD